jgi:uncharacterized protein YqcC (DUF446 family)
MSDHSIHKHIERIQEAMKKSGVWSENAPAWVYAYDGESIPDVWQWLQFIYFPMRLQNAESSLTYLAPQITSYLNQNPAFAPILQLIIELDAITPTFYNTKS